MKHRFEPSFWGLLANNCTVLRISSLHLYQEKVPVDLEFMQDWYENQEIEGNRTSKVSPKNGSVRCIPLHSQRVLLCFSVHRRLKRLKIFLPFRVTLGGIYEQPPSCGWTKILHAWWATAKEKSPKIVWLLIAHTAHRAS